MGTAGIQGTRPNCHKMAQQMRSKAGSALDGQLPKSSNHQISGSPNDLYRANNPKVLSNSKNRSSIVWGDNRDGQFKTMNLQQYKPYADVDSAPSKYDMLNKATQERKLVYDNATKRVTVEGVRRVEKSMMAKLQQRSGGGQIFRNAFNYFDRDKSGYIDLDEWFKVIELVGCSYNEDQLVALFGHYDVNCEGQLDYNSFIQRVVNGANPIPPRSEFKMFNVAKGKDRRYGAGPPLTYKIGQSVNKLVRWDVKRAFDKFDFEKAGWIEPREMPLLMVALGMHLNPSMVDTCLREMDSNCNGKIEFDEFFNWFEKEAERGTDAAMNGTRNRDGRVVGKHVPRADVNECPLLLHDLKLSY